MAYFKRQLDAINATIESKSLERLAIGKRMEGEGRTMDAEEQRTFDSLTSDIDALRADLKRYEGMEADAATARPVQPLADEKANRPIGPHSHSRSYAEARDTQTQEKGIGFARVARCIALAHLHHQDPAQIAKSVYPGDDRTLRTVTKAAVPAASTGNAGWAASLITDGGVGFADFVEFLRPLTLVGQVSGRLRRLPFDTPVLVQGTGGTAKWVKEGTAKPLTQWSYTRTKLAPLKVAAIAAATKETLMRASAAADALLRDELARAIAAAIDTTFIDPAVAPVADESPGSILNGVAPIAVSDGLSVADIRCDIATFLTAFADENLSVTGSFWVMPERIAIALSLIVNEVGTPAFPGITPNGGTLAGLPVFVTGYASTDSTGSVVALVKGDEIFLGDEEGIQVSMSDQASLIMDDAPNHNSTTPTGTNLVSMFQTNSVAFLCERHINWQRRRAQAVAWARVGWSACQSS